MHAKARRVSTAFGRKPLHETSSIKGRIIIIIPAGKEDPGGTPDLCKRVGEGGGANPQRSQKVTTLTDQSLTAAARDNVWVQTRSESWVAADLGGG